MTCNEKRVPSISLAVKCNAFWVICNPKNTRYLSGVDSEGKTDLNAPAPELVSDFDLSVNLIRSTCAFTLECKNWWMMANLNKIRYNQFKFRSVVLTIELSLFSLFCLATFLRAVRYVGHMWSLCLLGYLYFEWNILWQGLWLRIVTKKSCGSSRGAQSKFTILGSTLNAISRAYMITWRKLESSLSPLANIAPEV